jgi:hypothetical protein
VGYDVHITRRKDWSQAGKEITAEEWLAYVKQDSELSLFPQNGPYCTRWSGGSKHVDAWLDWSKGNVYTRNPDERLIDKMVAIARSLDARVQGDDGEIYQSGSEPPTQAQPSVLDRLRNWLRPLRPAPRTKEVTRVFRVGDRVLDAFRKEAIVVEISSKSTDGLAKVKVRYADGREATFALAASGLSPVEHTGKQT